jgi:hypothetical protein
VSSPRTPLSVSPGAQAAPFLEPRRISAPTYPSSVLRPQTPDPDYDAMSVASGLSSGGESWRSRHAGSSHEDLHRQVGPGHYYHHQGRSVSAMSSGIPRFAYPAARRGRGSLMSASPRLEHASPASSTSELFFARHGAHLASGESHAWYSDYTHEAFPHEAEFGGERQKAVTQNYDHRIDHIRGTDNKPSYSFIVIHCDCKVVC